MNASRHSAVKDREIPPQLMAQDPDHPAADRGPEPAVNLPPRPVRVCLLISSLELGGAERQVVEMARILDRRKIDPIICSLSEKVPLADGEPEVRKLLHIVPKRTRFDVGLIPRLAAFLRRERVDVIHAFLNDSEMAARLSAPFAGHPVVIASERNADYARRKRHQWTQVLTRNLFDVMVANSHAGARFSVRTLGLAEERLRVVHNGVNAERFKPDPEAGRRFRESIGLAPDAFVVGMVGNFKRQKDHATFLRMAARILEQRPDCRFLVAGGLVEGSPGSAAYAAEIERLADELGLGDRCRFLGSQEDMMAFYNACDVTALLSLHEGTPNVALESMACGKPVIATDVADNAIIIEDGTTGFVVPPKDWAAAADHVSALASDPGRLAMLSSRARNRVHREFTPERAACKLADIYVERFLARSS